MLLRSSVVIIFCSICTWATAWSWQPSNSNNFFELVETSPSGVIFALKPFELKISKAHSWSESEVTVTIPGYGVMTEPGMPLLPVSAALLDVPIDSDITVNILESQFEDLSQIELGSAPLIVEDLKTELPVYHFKKNQDVYGSDSFWPQPVAKVGEKGRLRGRLLARVEVSPLQYNPVSRTLRIYKSLKVQVKFSKPFARQSRRVPELENDLVRDFTSPFVLNNDQPPPNMFAYPTDSLVRSHGEWYDPQFTFYKFHVNEEGIYLFTYDDLVQAGISPESIPLDQIKIFSRGQEIPIRIAGPEGLMFQQQNRILFYGDRYRGVETYYDFYTDANVYWLTWDGNPGRRYQFGSQDTTPNQQILYWETLHLEQENIFHRENTTSVIDDAEGWIWRYFFDNDRESIEFEIDGLFKATVACSIRVRLHGTTRDPVNPDHHVRLLLNSELIGDAFFDEQDEFLWVLPFDIGLIREGAINKLELRLVPDTGAQVNQVYLDWIEIVYPRQHVASGSRLRFQDSDLSDGPTRFALVNFEDDSISVFDPVRGIIWEPESERMSLLKAESAGLDDGNFVSLSFDFVTYNFDRRGHNLLVIDQETGEVQTRSFDTFGSGPGANEMAAFINSLPTGTIVLAGIRDEGSANMTEQAYLALESLGSTLTRQVTFRDSWALIGRKGAQPGTVKEILSKRFAGVAMVADTLRGPDGFRFATSFVDQSNRQSFYYSTSERGIKNVSLLEKDEPSDLRASTNAADYLVLTHANFKREAERLVSYRGRHNGFRTLVVDIEDVYDEFSDGIIQPQAIKDFLHYTYLNWQRPAPSYLVLFGDASWDPMKRMQGSVKASYIPSYGILVSDNWFVSLDGPDDFLPDMFVGRIPVESADQAAIVVDKIIDYEALPFEAWNKELIFFNGGINASEQSVFSAQANLLVKNHVESLPFRGRVTQFNKTTSEPITVSFRNVAAEKIKEGALWVSFLGHAGSSVWDVDIGQPEDWQNTTIFPFITGMSCHSARFANPSQSSLAEKFVVNTLGACAYWGSTGFGYVTQDFFLLDGLFPAITKESVRSLGEATTRAKISLWQALGGAINSRKVIEQYTLIGDPALNLVLSTKPELAVRANEILFESDFLLTTELTTTVSAKVRNYGLIPSDSLEIQFSVLDAVGNAVSQDHLLIDPIGYVDSLQISVSVPQIPGKYRFQLQIDPHNLIAEEDEANNLAEKEIDVFASDLSIVKPMAFGVADVHNIELVVNNSRVAGRDLLYYFELDSNETFKSATVLRSPGIPEGELITKFKPEINEPRTYYWRVRTFDGSGLGPWAGASFYLDNSRTATWQQSSKSQFGLNSLEDVEVIPAGAIRLFEDEITFMAESAGFNDGSVAVLTINRGIFGQNTRGHNIVIYDELSRTVVASANFDTFRDEANAMAQFLSDLPDNSIVLAAINDEGSAGMTEGAHQALETIGSALTRQVGFRDSWAIIGRKGAAIGTVPEALKKSGEGPVSVADTLYRFAKMGRMISPEIGPALSWNSVEFDHEIPSSATRMEFQVLGRNVQTAGVDTLKTQMAAERIDLADVDVKTYPKLQLAASLFSEDGLSTPYLSSWAVDYTPPPDLIVGRGSVELQADSVLVGDEVSLKIKIGNFGLSPADSFSVQLTTGNSGAESLVLKQFQAPGLAVDEVADFETSFSSRDLAGQTAVRVILDSESALAELSDSNNEFSFNIWVTQDTVSPDIRVTFDGQIVAAGDFVATTPLVLAEIRDRSNLAFDDTAQVTILLDEQKVSYGQAPGQAQLIPQNNPQDPSLKVVSTFAPALPEGIHKIEVFARDPSGNLRYFQTEFHVSEDFILANVMNYPNPFRSETDFTYVLTQEADLVRLKIYTVAGRLIQEFDMLPTRPGFNNFRWDGRDFDGDTLSNGVYLYKLIARRGDQQKEVVEKLVVMR